MIVLVDMDGVLANFEKGFLDIWQARYGHLPYVKLEERHTFYIEDQYPEEHRETIYNIFCESGFFRHLAPIEGAIEAVREMATRFEVYICTSPLSGHSACEQEKVDWVGQHLGKAFKKRVILTSDKTLVRGDILIDDSPNVKGLLAPSWQHILYDAPCNRHIEDKQRLTWGNWKEVIPTWLQPCLEPNKPRL